LSRESASEDLQDSDAESVNDSSVYISDLTTNFSDHTPYLLDLHTSNHTSSYHTSSYYTSNSQPQSG